MRRDDNRIRQIAGVAWALGFAKGEIDGTIFALRGMGEEYAALGDDFRAAATHIRTLTNAFMSLAEKETAT